MSMVMAGLTLPLQKLQLDPAQLRAGIGPDHPLDLLGREVGSQAVNALIPAPGALACGAASSLQLVAFGRPASGASRTPSLVSPYRPAGSPAGSPLGTAGFWPVTLGSLVLMLLAETLLRFRVVSVFARGGGPIRTQRAGFAATVLGTSVRLGWRHFAEVTLHVWLLRMSMACLQVVLLVAPTVLAQRIFIPRVALMLGTPWLVQACVLLAALCTVLANGVLSAFAVVYDTRLFAALQRAE
jgi:hypothetical protein